MYIIRNKKPGHVRYDDDDDDDDDDDGVIILLVLYITILYA